MTDNDNLELKKRSRRRLVGAAALALLAAIVLPGVMEQEPAAPLQDIQVTIPERDADGALAKPISAAPPAGAQVVPPPEEQAPAAEAEADVAEPLPPSVSVASPAPAPAPRAELPAKSADRPAAADEAARVAALLEDRKPAPATAGAFVVQIGAYGEPAKANGIGADLKSRGFAAYTEKAGAVTRVRVGPFRSREEAERAAERLRGAGIAGVVVPK